MHRGPAAAESAPATPTSQSIRDERGQAMVLVAILLVVLLGIVGVVIDVGRAYLVQRSLQSSADAAALAGAASLPSSTVAVATAKRYGALAGQLNDKSDVGAVTETVQAKCLVSLSGCSPHNAVVVDESAQVRTSFLGLFGVNAFTVNVRSTACSPCDARPLDIMIVLDRTGSMCADHFGRDDHPNCTDLANARGGIKTFLGLLDPTADYVGLAVLPPAESLARKCNVPTNSLNFYNYNSTSSPYVLVPLSNDYATGSGLNNSSNLVSTLNCIQPAGSTSYATAIEKAQAELDARARPGTTKVIIFFSDGAANTGPSYYGNTSPYRTKPCHQGVTSANASKAKQTIVISIGYDLDAQNGGANVCTSYTGAAESPSISAYQALQQMASGSSWFYDQPSPGELSSLFSQVAADIGRGAARLVPNDTR